MADEHDIASEAEQRERDATLQAHAQRMAAIKPADDCRHCGEELIPVRKQWGSCIECATKAEQLAARGLR